MGTNKFTLLVLLILFSASFNLLPSRAYSQAESHNFITYDTTFNVGYAGLSYLFRVTRPANMFVANDPDTASRPAIITMGGVGEVGTNPANMAVYGPHYWLANGWDGGIQLANGLHYPIIISVQANQAWPQTTELAMVLNYILKTYHIKRNAVHLGGLSMGAMSWTALICHQASAGDETGMKMVTSLVALEGQSNTVSTAVQQYQLGGTSSYASFGHWAKKYNGKFFGLEGTADNGRNLWKVQQPMNDSVPGSAFFTYENYGGGAHCCWNSMYDPSVTDWQCVAPITNPNVQTNFYYPSSMGTYKKGWNIFQWMLRQGDTTMVGSTTTTPPPPVVTTPPTVSAGSALTVTLPVSTATLTGVVTPASGSTITGYAWTQVSGPSSVIVSPGALSTVITGLTTAGTYVYQLAATTNAQVTASNTVTLTVKAPLTTTPSPGTSTPGNLGGLTVKKVIVCEYRTWYIASDGNVYGFNNQSPTVMQFAINGRTAVDGAGAFNEFRVLDDQGFIWSSLIDYSTNTVRYDTDTTGAPFNGNIAVYAYANTTATIRSDGSVWYLGDDTFHLFHSTGGVEMLPTQLSPAGMVVKKLAMGGNRIVALTSSGDVYEWTYGKGTTPAKKTIPLPAIDIFASHLDYAGCLIPTAAGATTGYPYVWGYYFGAWGGTAPLTQPTSMQTAWGVQSPIKVIDANWNTTHYIDDQNRMWGLGFNVQGEVGIGTEQVNQYTYSSFPAYSWSFTDGQGFSGLPAKQIGTGIQWSQLFSNNWFSFYKYALDVNGNLYSWGRNKALDLGNGFLNMQEQYSPNSMDVLVPTLVTPLTTKFQKYNFTAPTISAGANQTVVGSTATLTGVATPATLIKASTTAANGIDMVGWKIISYKWSQVSGPNTAVINSPNTAITTLSGLTSGTYVFALLVTDNNTGTNRATVTITVSSVPLVPVANAGNDQTITLPTNSVTLTGSGSEVGGSIVSYAWTQVGGPSTATITNANQAQTTVSGLVQGVYGFQLTVTDNLGVKAAATMKVTVNAIVPGAPVANAGNAQTITLPTNSVTLTGSGSETNGTIVSYAWTQVGGPSTATIANANQAQTTVSGLAQGVYSFQLTVTDNSGVKATDVTKVTVNAAVVTPGVPIANAGSNQTITLPTNSSTLSGSGSETNGTIVSYIWTQVSGPSTAVIVSPDQPTTIVKALAQGVYSFQLTVTDNSGVTASDVVKVTVNPAAVTPGVPVVNAGADQTITLPTNSSTLSGSGSETNGTIVSYVWTQASGPSTAVIVSPNQATTIIKAMVQGVYIFQLTITDNSGVTATDVVKVTVNAPVTTPGGPTANAGANQTITLPTSSSTLGGSGSEVGGTIVSYAWTQISGPSTAVIVSPDQATTIIKALVAGVYAFQLTVTDNSGATATDVVKVTVNAAPVANLPPVAIAGPNETISVAVTSLDGSASYDPDGTIAKYQWLQLSGAGGVTITGANTPTPNIYGLAPGVYVFGLTVTDNEGATGNASVSITVLSSQPNQSLPVANAGRDTSIVFPQVTSIVLDGSGSYDPGGTLTSYSWKQLSGPAAAQLDDPTGIVTTASQLVVGDYTFVLTVTDDHNVSASDTVAIHVQSDLRHSGYIKLYPNPVVNSQVALEGSNDYTGTVKFNIYDIGGRLVKQAVMEKQYSDFRQVINVPELGRGVYILTILFNGGSKVETLRFVID